MHAAKFSKGKHRNAPKSAPQPVQKPAEKIANASKSVHIKVDADKMRLSHVLQLKECLTEHRGTNPLEITFYR